ncbi:Acyl-CoA synthetase [Granulibacter bethesdensis]|uniref:Acyl-CoA synthetase n=1 Tax=Granulibacter bethesdensis TaxID=364410 RepID=A0AAN0RBV2_9PROT|nr:fatty acyl-AMP ligase [Granulibacter bethesdensis]AHJ61995.1 Acyl-CoA synthetase [Granulibacter bethesdensis]
MHHSVTPTPSDAGTPRRLADFPTLPDALDYAATGQAGLNFYSGRGVLQEALPYRELRRQAQDNARRLLALGLNPGDRIALIAENDGNFVRLFWACQYAGLVPAPLPLPAAFAGREGYIANIRRMIESAQASAAFAPDLLNEWLQEATEGLNLVFTGTATMLHTMPVPGMDLPAIDPDALSYLQFSSGSTRFPLGVAVTQRAAMANAAAISQHGLAFRDGDRGVSWLPLYHDMGLVGFLLTPLTCQISVDFLPTREFARRPLVWLDLISRNRGTLSYSPSFGYELCARRAESALETLDLSSWRIAGIGGDMIRPQVLRDFAARFATRGFSDRAFVPSYGMAEVTLALSFSPHGGGLHTDVVARGPLEHQGLALASVPEEQTGQGRDFVLCGPALPGYTIEIRGEDGTVLPERRVGVIYARGPSIMTGYFAQPEATSAVLSADGWLNTGDLGYLLNGQIVVTGRAKDLIIVNGRNIWPQDLEWSAESHIPALRSRDVVVFSIDNDAQEKVVALLQCRLSDPAAREALQQEAASLFLRQHGVEVSVILVPPRSLPQTSSGKLSRARARQMLLTGAFESDPVSSVA